MLQPREVETNVTTIVIIINVVKNVVNISATDPPFCVLPAGGALGS